MKRFLAIIIGIALLISISGCAQKPQAPKAPANEFRFLYGSEYTTMNYLIVGNTYELRAASNAIDGLTEYDQFGVVKPALAESWSSNADNTVWTFKIRQGVKWVDKNGKEVAEVTAQDWVDAAKYVNDAHNDSSIQYMYDDIVKNANDYYEQTAEILDAENAVTNGEAASVEAYFSANGVDPASFISFDDVGVKAVDKYTLQYTMEDPIPFFVSVLSYASYLPVYGPFLREQGANFGLDNERILYCGAYILSKFEPNVTHEFTKNPLYWDKESQHLDKIIHIYNADERTLGPTMLQRGEVDEANIGADILDNWLSGADTKNLVRPSMPDISYSYFYGFNFEPRFDARYEPENWIKAVNNENFRQALRHGLDRMKALTVMDPHNPKALRNNTVTPATFAVGAGKDYTAYAPLQAITNGDSFNDALAKSFRDKAKAELSAAGATFPIKVLMKFNPTTTNWGLECQVVQQQLEELLGSDFINIIVEAGPETGFLGAVRRSGDYAFMKLNWGADYADPQTWAEPFGFGNSYIFQYTNPNRVVGGKPVTNKSRETQNLVTEYYKLVDAAKASISDEAARYEAFAKAEAFFIEHAFVIPYSVDSDGYISSRIDPFTRMFAPYGLSPFRYKHLKLLPKPMTMDEYNTALAKWRQDWTAAQAAAK